MPDLDVHPIGLRVADRGQELALRGAHGKKLYDGSGRHTVARLGGGLERFERQALGQVELPVEEEAQLKIHLAGEIIGIEEKVLPG
ncbi:MAG TPA: hypothetical protein VLQ45_34025 [Thermoanaerobaculia bacterium]|nr:hypothetical protein [Thermoanaerobaculia bacterium]